ncbi:MAG TPA: CDP-glycerol glycerophosphotransferase family protein [Longimicrobiales bacterium]
MWRIARSFLRWARATAREILIWCAFKPLETFLPVDRDLWCFCTWDRYAHTLDNPRAVFEEVKHDPAIRKVVLYRGNRPPAEPIEGTNVRFIEAESLLGMVYAARAGVILLGYALRVMSSYSRYLTTKHHLIQLWHGVPLKRIGRLFPGELWWEAETPRYAATVSSSERDRSIMQQAFAPIPLERVWLTGLPRNDLILKDEAALPGDYRDQLRELRDRIGDRRFVLYAPTWRAESESLYAFSREEIAALEELLEAHHAVLGVRGHSNVRSHAAYTSDYRSEAFLNVNDVPDVNVMLRITDVLITDYSSIYIDFLLTDRPIIHFVYDLEAYQSERGVLYDIPDAFGGPAARTFDDLLSCLEQALDEPDAGLERRHEARRLFHTHPDHSARLVADNIRRLTGTIAHGGRGTTGPAAATDASGLPAHDRAAINASGRER